MDASDAAVEVPTVEPDAAGDAVDARGSDAYDGATRTDAAGAEVQCWNIYPMAGCGAKTPAPSCVTQTGACTIPACSCDGKVILGCHAYAQPYAYTFCGGGVCPNAFEAAGSPCDPAGCDGGPCPLPSRPDGSVDQAPDGGGEDACAPDALEDAPVAADGAMPSDASDAAPSTPAWTPAGLSGVVLWLEADWGIEAAPGEAVLRWGDRSGRNNHASQPDRTAAPRLAAAAVGGSAAVRFADPSWLIVVDTGSMRWGREDFALLVVERKASACHRCEGQQLFFHKSEASAPWTGPQLYLMIPDRKFRAYVNDEQDVWSTSGDFGGAATHVLGVRRTATAIDLRADGLSAGRLPIVSAVNVDAVGRNSYIGAHGIAEGQFQFEGDIAAIIAVRGALADADLARLEDYLLTKYDVPGRGPPEER